MSKWIREANQGNLGEFLRRNMEFMLHSWFEMSIKKQFLITEGT
jgi:hypothetical protein